MIIKTATMLGMVLGMMLIFGFVWLYAVIECIKETHDEMKHVQEDVLNDDIN